MKYTKHQLESMCINGLPSGPLGVDERLAVLIETYGRIYAGMGSVLFPQFSLKRLFNRGFPLVNVSPSMAHTWAINYVYHRAQLMGLLAVDAADEEDDV